MSANYMGGMFGLFFSDVNKIETFEQVMKCSQDKFRAFFHGMLAEGVYFAPSAFEAGFISMAHSTDDIEKTLQAASRVLGKLNN